jgi:hypothetical protein
MMAGSGEATAQTAQQQLQSNTPLHFLLIMHGAAPRFRDCIICQA